MRVRRFIWLMSFLLGLLLAGCSGGSGSSGFDNFPNAENAAIQTALDEQQCVIFNGLNICPADTAVAIPTPLASVTPGITPTPTGSTIGPTPARTHHPGVTASPTPTATPTPSPPPQLLQTPSVDTGINTGAVPCTLSDAANTCVLVVPFAPEGFPTGTLFRVAVRTVDPPSPWSIGSVLTPTGAPNAPAFDAPVAIDAQPTQADRVVRIQVAILAWVVPPARIPATVPTLGDSAASYAFVTSDRDVQPAPTAE